MKPTLDEIDNLLPQTQCGLCGFGGCLPYAKAMVETNAPIDLCPPGGVKTLQHLGTAFNLDVTPLLEEMKSKEKPTLTAIIRENECIGCTKCIQACPVDAIIGGTKMMHIVIESECSGCELCISPCPVDCIEMIEVSDVDTDQRREQYRERYRNRELRLVNEIAEIKEFTPDNNKKNYLNAVLNRNVVKS